MLLPGPADIVSLNKFQSFWFSRLAGYLCCRALKITGSKRFSLRFQFILSNNEKLKFWKFHNFGYFFDYEFTCKMRLTIECRKLFQRRSWSCLTIIILRGTVFTTIPSFVQCLPKIFHNSHFQGNHIHPYRIYSIKHMHPSGTQSNIFIL